MSSVVDTLLLPLKTPAGRLVVLTRAGNMNSQPANTARGPKGNIEQNHGKTAVRC